MFWSFDGAFESKLVNGMSRFMSICILQTWDVLFLPFVLLKAEFPWIYIYRVNVKGRFSESFTDADVTEAVF